MQLTFETMDELREMIAAMGYVKHLEMQTSAATHTSITPAEMRQSAVKRYGEERVAAAERGEVLLSDAEPEESEAECAAAMAGTTDVHQPTKRKRRTKAEIEADKAAQTLAEAGLQAGVPAVAEAPKANPLDNLKPEPPVSSNGDPSHAEIAEMAGLFDGNDKLAHLNEGRAFIEKYTFPVYNETLTLADVPANIAAHTPEQVSRHRAAMAWLAAQKAG